MSDEISLVSWRGDAVGSDLLPDPGCASERRRQARLHVVATGGVHLPESRTAEVSARPDAAPRLVLVGDTDTTETYTGERRAASDALKRLTDILCASVLLILFSPLMAVVAVLIRLSGAPILFRQQRIGRRGAAFRLFKFRTMVPDAEARLEAVLRADPALRAEWDSNQKLRHDPRITALGAFLRRTSIDELPQLLNVLAGDMSMVGPRPVLREELERYGADARAYLSVRPGVTGLWQVSGRNSTCYARRIALDTEYVSRRSVRLDAFILLKTVYVVLFRVGAH